MTMRTIRLLSCLAIAIAPVLAHAADTFSFGVIAKPGAAGIASVREAITQTDADNLAFVVANGIKTGNEPCTDELYQQRKALYDDAKNGLLLTLAAGDWAYCVNEQNRSNAAERIARIREMFFSDEFSFGDSKLPVIRQSAIPQFRIYAENMHWRIGDVLFATINLPNNNNNFQNAAGRNSEYEDRQVANTDWLKRLFITAKSGKNKAIVLFTDANPLAHRGHTTGFFSNERRPGFAEIRRQLQQLAGDFQGRVLIVHSDTDSNKELNQSGIVWQGNIGAVRVDPAWLRVSVDTGKPAVFALTRQIPTKRNSTR